MNFLVLNLSRNWQTLHCVYISSKPINTCLATPAVQFALVGQTTGIVIVIVNKVWSTTGSVWFFPPTTWPQSKEANTSGKMKTPRRYLSVTSTDISKLCDSKFRYFELLFELVNDFARLLGRLGLLVWLQQGLLWDWLHWDRDEDQSLSGGKLSGKRHGVSPLFWQQSLLSE